MGRVGLVPVTLLVNASLWLLAATAGGDDSLDATAPTLALGCREPVNIIREVAPPVRAQMRLVDCQGRVEPRAAAELGRLALPDGGEHPHGAPLEGTDVTLDPGLLLRLQALVDHFQVDTVQIVSGIRPRARATSRHRRGRALDVDLIGVPKERVMAFCQTLPRTGCGYYPNSTFTHLDVRLRRYAWVDESPPGLPGQTRPLPAAEAEEAALAQLLQLPLRPTDSGASEPSRSEEEPVEPVEPTEPPPSPVETAAEVRDFLRVLAASVDASLPASRP